MSRSCRLFAVHTVKKPPWTFVAIAGIALLSIVLDALFRRSGRDSSSAPAAANQAT